MARPPAPYLMELLTREALAEDSVAELDDLLRQVENPAEYERIVADWWRRSVERQRSLGRQEES